MTDPDPDEPTTTDADRLQRLEQFMAERGFIRHRECGFWILAPAAVVQPQQEDEDDEDQ
jgi:hypothetical protein